VWQSPVVAVMEIALDFSKSKIPVGFPLLRNNEIYNNE